MHTYKAKVLEKLNTVRIKVGVFRVEDTQEELVGEYERNYALLNTFCCFRKDDREYALYSPNYSATRIMELPSCKDLGGEETSSNGFCPTDYYVPSYIDREITWHNGLVARSRVHEPRPENLKPEVWKATVLDAKTGEKIEVEDRSYPVSSLLYYPFGFVAGCLWGDDSTWKIQYLDLSEADKGIVKRDERFGYIVLPEKLRLKEAVDMSDYDPDDKDPYTKISITITKRFDLDTGESVDY